MWISVLLFASLTAFSDRIIDGITNAVVKYSENRPPDAPKAFNYSAAIVSGQVPHPDLIGTEWFWWIQGKWAKKKMEYAAKL